MSLSLSPPLNDGTEYGIFAAPLPLVSFSFFRCLLMALLRIETVVCTYFFFCLVSGILRIFMVFISTLLEFSLSHFSFS